MARTFTLGGPILKTGDSTAYAPDTWREALLRELDSAGRANLALTCKPALQWLLEDSEQATLTVPVKSGERAEALLRRLRAAKQDLAKRGAKATELVLQQDGVLPKGERWWLLVFTAFDGTPAGPDFTLAVEFSEISQEMLAFAGEALPGLSSLTLGTPLGEAQITLPHPAAFPTLKHLTIRRVAGPSQAQFWDSLRSYKQQLEGLYITDTQPMGSRDPVTHRPYWSKSFTGGVSHVIRQLEVPCELDPWLVGLLREQTPALRELTVHGVSVQQHPGEAVPAPESVSWQRLVVRAGPCCLLSQAAWAWLPTPTEGTLSMEFEGAASVIINLSQVDQAVQKLKTYELIDCVLVVIDNDMHTQPESDQLTALRAALPLLAPHLQSPTAVLQLNKLRLSDQLAAELTAAAAAGWHWLSVDQLTLPAAPAVVTAKLPVLRRVGLADALTDARLAQLRQCVSQAMQLSVSALALQSALPAGVELPWGTLRVKEPILMADWLEQAELLGGQCKWYIERLRVQLSNEEITQGEHYRVATDLYSRNVTNVSEVEVLPTSNAPIDQARELRACLYALASLSCIPKALSLKYWPAAEAVVAELRGLPEWSCTLGLGFESWGVVPRSTYSQAQGHRWPLARAVALIPYMYHTWCLRDSDLEKQEVEALVLSAPADYTADLPLHIQLRSRDQGLVSILRTLMSASGTYPHVTVDAADA